MASCHFTVIDEVVVSLICDSRILEDFWRMGARIEICEGRKRCEKDWGREKTGKVMF